uniref:Reverse transcriptase domain-containing protein n=1 Tax=Morchella brunnea TaxID=1174671 RepID=A0A8K1I7Q1_9PEZI|nr:hypothetical protein LK370_mgp191 [Morchella brunnea]UBU98369.1 hypothetical protein [Morchella brunnea]
MAANWPEWQCAYKTGRGTSTAWTKILSILDHAAYIYEFDLVGYFNSVRIDTVGRELMNFGVPKYITWHLMSLFSGDVENITPKRLIELKEGEFKDTWKKVWTKYEYLHKYREGWRSRALPQGSGISPILSVLPLICLEGGAKKEGLNIIMYADDGIIYGNKELDYHIIAENTLSENCTGATLCPTKSGWVKKGGVWLTPLKFVGLTYDPHQDILHASTRKGSILPLYRKVMGLFTVHKNLHSKLFDMKETYEEVFQKYLMAIEVWEDTDIGDGQYSRLEEIRTLYQRLLYLDKEKLAQNNTRFYEAGLDEYTEYWEVLKPTRVKWENPYDLEALIGHTIVEEEERAKIKAAYKERITSFLSGGWTGWDVYPEENDKEASENSYIIWIKKPKIRTKNYRWGSGKTERDRKQKNGVQSRKKTDRMKKRD